MKPLIDSDILAYEIGFASQKNINGEIIPVPLGDVTQMVDNKIKEICAAVYATEPPVLYLTGRGNFRNDVAKQQAYKGKRKNAKPFHYAFIRAYMMAEYEHFLVNGMEADDLLCIHQTERLAQRDTIICSRDKDLKQCPGYHYGWECGKQGAFGPEWVDELGWIKLKSPKKLIGTGEKLFYAQVLMGDDTDDYAGLEACGPIGTFKILSGCNTTYDLFDACLEAYGKKYGVEEGRIKMKEMAQLAYMIRGYNEDGSIKMWEMLDEDIRDNVHRT